MPDDKHSSATAQRVLRAQSGDVEAMEALLRDAYPGLMRFASHLIKDRDVAQDVTQEAAIKLVQKIEQLAEPAAFSSWAKTTLRREAFEFLRRQKRNPAEANRDDDTNLKYASVDDGRAFLTGEEMESCLRQLRREDRNLLNLHYWCGFEVKEIAAILGIAAGAVKTRLFRARNRLRDLLCEPEWNPVSQ
jgi:RNA polymerase sigma-70 factor (ECF subfamily)